MTAGAARATFPATPVAGFPPARQAAVWMYLGLFAIMGGVMVADYQTFRVTAPEVLLAIVLWAAFLAVALWVIDRLDQFDREPWSLRLAAFGWGFVIAASVAHLGNLATVSVLAKLAPSLTAPHLLAPIGPAVAVEAPSMEETIKLLGVVAIALIAPARFRRLTVGMIFGLLVGLGFQVQEDIGYALANGLSAGGTDAVTGTFFSRAVLTGWHSHAVYTGIAGLGVAYYLTRTEQSRTHRLLVALALYGLAWFAHFLQDGPSNALGLPGQLLSGALTVVALYLLYRWARRSDHRRLAATLTSGGDPAATAAEAQALASPRHRRRARRAARREHGRTGARLVADLQRAQLRYAAAVRHEDPTAAAAHRRRITEIRGSAPPPQERLAGSIR